MFDTYYHSVSYEKQSGKDKYNNFIYESPIQVKVRCVDNTHSLSVKGENQDTDYKHIYHIPFKVTEGDKIDSLIVSKVRASQDIHGNIYFYIVGVI